MSERFKELTEEDVKMYFDPAWVHYTASLDPPRPGLALFSSTLEHQFFPPGTPENANYIILTTAWLHESIWLTISIPKAKQHLAEAVAKYFGLKILETIPVVSVKYPAFGTVKMETWEQLKEVDPRWEIFPLHHGVNMFCLENSEDHPVKAGTMTMSEWIVHEMDMMKKIVGEREWTEEDDEEMKRFIDYMKTD